MIKFIKKYPRSIMWTVLILNGCIGSIFYLVAEDYANKKFFQFAWPILAGLSIAAAIIGIFVKAKDKGDNQK